jgi:hypothetical protein
MRIRSMRIYKLSEQKKKSNTPLFYNSIPDALVIALLKNENLWQLSESWGIPLSELRLINRDREALALELLEKKQYNSIVENVA